MRIHYERAAQPATLARLTQQALDLHIPEEAELVIEYDDEPAISQPAVFFQWHEDAPEGKHRRPG